MHEYQILHCPNDERVAESSCMPAGQSFRWRKTADEPLEFTGVVGKRLVVLQQSSDDVSYRVVARGPGEVAGVCSAQCFASSSRTHPFGRISEHESSSASDAALMPLMPRCLRGAAAGDALALEDYFQKSICLSDLSDNWASRDQRFRQV